MNRKQKSTQGRKDQINEETKTMEPKSKQNNNEKERRPQTGKEAKTRT